MASSRITGTNENISTYAASGADYTSLATWEAATDNDLVTAETTEVLECEAGTYDDTVLLQGATTDSSYFRIIRPATGEGHDGTANTGVIFAATSHASVATIAIGEDYGSVQDLVLNYSVSTASAAYGGRFQGAGNADNATFIGCIVSSGVNSGAGAGHGFGGSSSTNCGFINCLASGIDDEAFALTSGTTNYLYNCTAIGGTYGFRSLVSTDVVAKNCLASGNATACFNGTFGATSTNNAASDGTAPGVVTYQSQIFTFVDSASDDYHLHRNDLGAKFRGTDLSEDATFAFDDDIDGDTITNWSIGFHAEETQQSSRRTGDNENVSTYAASGADFSSLAVWEAATDNDLVTAETTEVLECEAGAYTDSVTLAGATTDASYFRIIRAALAAKHGGDPTTGARFTATATVVVFSLAEANSQVQDVVGTLTIDSASNGNTFLLATNGDENVFVGCIAYNSTNAGAGLCHGFNVSGGTNGLFVNCLAVACKSNGFGLNTETPAYVYNCTSIGNSNGFSRSLGTLTCTNCLASLNSTADFTGTFHAASVTNASSDDTAPGTGSRTEQTFSFIGAASDNYHLAFADEGAKGFATSMATNPYYNFTDDIDGDEVIEWSIGFDSDPEEPASGGGSFLLKLRRR